MQVLTEGNEALAEVGRQLAGLPVLMLTNVGVDGSLRSRPMAPLEMDAEGAIWFFTDLRSDTVEHLRVLGLSWADPLAGTWLSLSGRGEIDTEPTRIQRWWSPRVQAWFPDGPGSHDLALLKFVPLAADLWSAPHGRARRLWAQPQPQPGPALPALSVAME